MAFPSVEETEDWLMRLAEGRVSSQAASDWAMPYVTDESTHPERMNMAVWEALTALGGADLPAGRDEPLYGPEDFADWLDAFRANVRDSR